MFLCIKLSCGSENEQTNVSYKIQLHHHVKSWLRLDLLLLTYHLNHRDCFHSASSVEKHHHPKKRNHLRRRKITNVIVMTTFMSTVVFASSELPSDYNYARESKVKFHLSAASMPPNIKTVVFVFPFSFVVVPE